MISENSFVAVFKSHAEAVNAIRLLQQAKFDMRKLSIIARDSHTEEHVVGYYNAGDRMKYWGLQGSFWGGLWGMLFGSAFFWIPGIGPLVIAGPMIDWIVSALEGAIVVGGLSAIGAGLYSIGIPKDSVLAYEVALTAGKYVLVANGSKVEIAHAQELIKGIETEVSKQHPIETKLLTSDPIASAAMVIQL